LLSCRLPKNTKVNISGTFQKKKREKLSNQLAHQPNQFSAAAIYSSKVRSGKLETMEFFYNKNCGSGQEGLKLQHETLLKLIKQ
jgi:hypothetical protein